MDAAYDGIVGAVAIKQVRRSHYEPGNKIQAGRLSGGLDPQQFYLIGGMPKARWDSMDLAGVLTGISISAGLYVGSGTITIPWNRRSNGGTFAGSSANFTLTGANGLTVITGLGASQGDEGAIANLETHFISTDGLTAPIASAVNQTLSAQAYNASHALGPVLINGSSLGQVVSVRVNPGITVEAKPYNGGIWPVLIYITARDPTIEITFEDLDALNTYGPLIAAMSSCAVYFRKKSDGGTFVSDGTSVHCKLSFAGGIIDPQQAAADANNNASATLSLKGKVLTASAASAIP